VKSALRRYRRFILVILLFSIMGSIVNLAELSAYIWPGPAPTPTPVGRVILRNVSYTSTLNVLGYPIANLSIVYARVVVTNDYSVSRYVTVYFYISNHYVSSNTVELGPKSTTTLILSGVPKRKGPTKFEIRLYSSSVNDLSNTIFEGSSSRYLYVVRYLTISSPSPLILTGAIKVSNSYPLVPNLGRGEPGEYTITLEIKSLDIGTSSFRVLLVDQYGHVLWPDLDPNSHVTETNSSVDGSQMIINGYNDSFVVKLPFRYITSTTHVYLYVIYNGTAHLLTNATISIKRDDIVNVTLSCPAYLGIAVNRGQGVYPPPGVRCNITFTLNKRYKELIYPNPVNIKLYAFNSSLVQAYPKYGRWTQLLNSFTKISITLTPEHPKGTITFIYPLLFKFYGIDDANYSVPVPFQTVIRFKVSSSMSLLGRGVPYTSFITVSNIIGVFEYVATNRYLYGKNTIIPFESFINTTNYNLSSIVLLYGGVRAPSYAQVFTLKNITLMTITSIDPINTTISIAKDIENGDIKGVPKELGRYLLNEILSNPKEFIKALGKRSIFGFLRDMTMFGIDETIEELADVGDVIDQLGALLIYDILAYFGDQTVKAEYIYNNLKTKKDMNLVQVGNLKVV